MLAGIASLARLLKGIKGGQKLSSNVLKFPKVTKSELIKRSAKENIHKGLSSIIDYVPQKAKVPILEIMKKNFPQKANSVMWDEMVKADRLKNKKYEDDLIKFYNKWEKEHPDPGGRLEGVRKYFFDEKRNRFGENIAADDLFRMERNKLEYDPTEGSGWWFSNKLIGADQTDKYLFWKALEEQKKLRPSLSEKYGKIIPFPTKKSSGGIVSLML